MKFEIVLVLSLVVLGSHFGFTQDTIKLRNASFEEFDENVMRLGQVPREWIDLGDATMTPVDIQPGQWNVDKPAQEGSYYVGMVARDNNTWEGIGQKLDGVLKKDSEYDMSIWLAKAPKFRSKSPLSVEEVLFNAPTILKIWGYNEETKEEELLAQSQPIGNEVWTKYSFTLAPKLGSYTEIDLVVYYAPGHENENGNLLIDNCSDIVEKSK